METTLRSVSQCLSKLELRVSEPAPGDTLHMYGWYIQGLVLGFCNICTVGEVQ